MNTALFIIGLVAFAAIVIWYVTSPGLDDGPDNNNDDE